MRLSRFPSAVNITKSLMTWGPFILITLFLSVMIPHTAMLLQKYEDWWQVAWAMALATEAAVVVATYYRSVAKPEHQTALTAALAFFLTASATFNSVHYINRGMFWPLATLVGTFIPIAVAILARFLGLRNWREAPEKQVEPTKQPEAVIIRPVVSEEPKELAIAQELLPVISEPAFAVIAGSGNGHDKKKERREFALACYNELNSIRLAAAKADVAETTLRYWVKKEGKQ